MLLSLCMLDGKLPQGAPTSPFLANMVTTELDVRLAAYVNELCQPEGCTYTRYADDLCFSSNSDMLGYRSTRSKIAQIVRLCGFQVNYKKSKLNRFGRRQTITGVVVNEKMNVSRSIRRWTRAAIRNLKVATEAGKYSGREMERLKGMVGHISNLSEYHGGKLKRQLDQVVETKEALGL